MEMNSDCPRKIAREIAQQAFFCVIGTVNPEPCPPGFFSRGGEKSCHGCPVGFFAAARNSTSCEICWGTYTPADRAVRCISCSSGQYLADVTNTSCTLCASGFFRNETGLSCTGCPQGWDTRNTRGSGKCLEIDDSKLAQAPILDSIVYDGEALEVTYHNADDESCKEIMLVYTNDEKELSTSTSTIFHLSHINAWEYVVSVRARCVDPYGRLSPPSPSWFTASRCEKTGEYLQVFSDEENQREVLPLYASGAQRGPTCAQCPEGIDCQNVTVGTVRSLRAKDGFWLLPRSLRRSFGETTRCIGKCIRGACASPYSGPLCGHCEAGAMLTFGRGCSVCPSHGIFLAQAIGLSLFIFGIATYIIYMMAFEARWTSSPLADFLTLSLRIMTSYFQVAFILSIYKMKFPPAVSGIISGQTALSSPGEVIINVDCLEVSSSAMGFSL